MIHEAPPTPAVATRRSPVIATRVHDLLLTGAGASASAGARARARAIAQRGLPLSVQCSLNEGASPVLDLVLYFGPNA